MPDDEVTEEEWEHASAPDEIAELMDPGAPAAQDGDYWRGAYDPDSEEQLRAEQEAEDEQRAQEEAEMAASMQGPQWAAIGELLWRARNELGISKREASRRAGLSEGAWRHLESGKKIVNRTIVEPNPRNENLVAAARAVGLDPADLFDLADRELPPGLVERTPDDEVIRRYQQLSDSDKQLVEQLVERLTTNPQP